MMATRYYNQGEREAFENTVCFDCPYRKLKSDGNYYCVKRSEAGRVIAKRYGRRYMCIEFSKAAKCPMACPLEENQRKIRDERKKAAAAREEITAIRRDVVAYLKDEGHSNEDIAYILGWPESKILALEKEAEK